LRWEDEVFQTVPVRRLYLNLNKAPDPDRWEYDNPWIGEHLARFLAEEKPDIFHLISGYLMTAAAINAAKRVGLPTLLTLTDFWFICPRITLQRTGGQLCESHTALDCVRCKFEQKRRFGLPAAKLPGVTKMAWQSAKLLPPIAAETEKIERRSATLRQAINQVDVAICPSHFLKNSYYAYNLEAKDMRFMRQGVNVPPPIAGAGSDQDDQLRIGYIGQIAPHKGVHVLVEAFKQTRKSNLVLNIYGNLAQFPEYVAPLKEIANQDKRINFSGVFSRDTLAQVFSKIDVLVVPSVWYENSPNAILEAFAYGTPVIASKLGGMAELVRHEENGLLFAPNSAADLAAKLQLIASKPDILLKFKENISPPYPVETEMRQLTAIYQALMPTT
jgi:glycosyltransferase involved in cell wall biosynthesis